ncbi:patatin-like protein 3 [Humulus lupulus]|uniref:patatin-like protein 3 n=1 Tax=Humulus lupulus TaxID=3486 RepID=UPI002B4182D9|nr:patatin-like protein 3 [Humulus lupulus]
MAFIERFLSADICRRRPPEKVLPAAFPTIAGGILKDKRLGSTLTNVVIPAYDINKFKPVVFSTYAAKSSTNLNAKLADVCISTSAAPVYLPAYKFSNGSLNFNMIDGGVAANNPTLLAIQGALEKKGKIDTPLVIISLGTGTESTVGKYNVEMVNNWWAPNWINNPSRNVLGSPDRPILDIFADASSDMVEHYCSIFTTQSNYLRVQDSLPKDLVSLDKATPENLNKLEQFAKNLLKKPVTKLSQYSFDREIASGNLTYEQALDRLAHYLVELKKRRGGEVPKSV